MPTVWNKFTSHLGMFSIKLELILLALGAFFNEEKRPAPLRPSHSLSMLNQKNLRVVPSSRSSENLHKISLHTNASEMNSDESPSKKPWKKLSSSSSHFFNFRKNARKSSIKKNGAAIPSPSTSITTTATNTPRRQTPVTSKF